MRIPPSLHRLGPAAAIAASVGLLSVAGVLLSVQVGAIRGVRREAVTALRQLPRQERRLDVLREQLEAAELERSLRDVQRKEHLEAFVVPSEPELDRLLATLDVAREWLQSQKMLLGMSAVEVGPLAQGEGDGSSQTVSFEVRVTEEGLRSLLSFLELTGDLSVGDALSREELRLLLAATEQENPAAVTSLEAFLAVDLLRYAREPKTHEEQLKRSLASDAFADTLASVIHQSSLSEAKRLLGGELGKMLEREKLWPTRLLSIDRAEVSREEGVVRARWTLRAHMRGA